MVCWPATSLTEAQLSSSSSQWELVTDVSCCCPATSTTILPSISRSAGAMAFTSFSIAKHFSRCCSSLGAQPPRSRAKPKTAETIYTLRFICFISFYTVNIHWHQYFSSPVILLLLYGNFFTVSTG